MSSEIDPMEIVPTELTLEEPKPTPQTRPTSDQYIRPAQEDVDADRLIKKLNKAISSGGELTPDDMHGRFVNFGKHKGERWTRVPVMYLRWCVNQLQDPARKYAELELARRGTSVEPINIELSGHAIDRASTRLQSYWLETREGDEGLYSWLARIAKEAYDASGMPTFDEDTVDRKSQDIEIYRNGIKMVFMIGRYYPVLKTISPDKE